jgi:tRNA U34 5-carboxymethylaminomethyl modifying GTPase MnmE/TrmE
VLWVEAAESEAAATPGWIGSGASAVVRVENKRDLGSRREGWVGACSRDGQVDAVRGAMRSWLARGEDQAWIGLARHRDRVADADEALARAVGLLEAEEPALELVAFELGIAQARLGEITGRHELGATGTDVLDAIFSRFCVGK